MLSPKKPWARPAGAFSFMCGSHTRFKSATFCRAKKQATRKTVKLAQRQSTRLVGNSKIPP